ncbi:hypothetical protein TNCV_3626521 [Trichonephila clavipes]|nr:hypothetical protein TNCV_3626521 [Trichonephila clavipes]
MVDAKFSLAPCARKKPKGLTFLSPHLVRRSQTKLLFTKIATTPAGADKNFRRKSRIYPDAESPKDQQLGGKNRRPRPLLTMENQEEEI